MIWRMTKFFTNGVYTCRLIPQSFATTECDHVQCRPICTELHVLSAVDRQYNARNKTEEMFKPL